MPLREYEAIIFDCDGTLTDSMPVHFLAWRKTLAEYGVAFSEERFYALAGMPTERIVRLLAREQGRDVDARQVAEQKEALFLESLGLLEPIEPVVEVARHFRGQIPMAVASGGYRGVIEQQLRQIGCEGWFSVLVTAEDTERHKPDPDVFLEAARRMQIQPGRCLVYEDADLGVQAAQAAGMDCCDVRTFHYPRRLQLDS